MALKITDNFRTDNFQLASYLLSKGCIILSVDKTNPKRVVFIFKDSEKLRELNQTFLSYDALVEPHRLYSAQKDLKQMIYQK